MIKAICTAALVVAAWSTPIAAICDDKPTKPADKPATNDDIKEAAKKPTFLIGKDKNDLIVSHWPLAFRHGEAPGYVKNDGSSPAAGAAASAGTIKSVADTLNTLFEDVSVQPCSDGLLIVGPKERVRRVKAMLAKWIDVPFPQVNLTVLSFQAASKNYNAERISDAVEKANAGIVLTREFLRAYVIDFADFISKSKKEGRAFLRKFSDPDKARINELYGMFHLLGRQDIDGADFEDIESGMQRVKPFVDDLAYLALSNPNLYGDEGTPGTFQNFMGSHDSHKLLASFNTQLGDQLNVLRDPQQLAQLHISADQAKRGIDMATSLQDLCHALGRSAYPAFKGFNATLGSSDLDNDLHVLLEFMREYSLPYSYEQIDPREALRREVKQEGDRLRDLLGAQTDNDARIVSARSVLSDSLESIGKLRKRIFDLQPTDSQDAIKAAKDKAKADLATAKVKEATLTTEQKRLAKLIAATRNRTRLKELKEQKAKVDKDLASTLAEEAKLQKVIDDPNGGISTATTLLKDLNERLEKALADEAAIEQEIDQLGARGSALDQEIALCRQRIETEDADLRDPGRMDSTYAATRPVDPESLSMLSSNVDELIKNATDAFSQDLDTAILTPLRDWIQANNRGKKDGLVYTGKIGLAVTSSRGAASGGSATMFTPYTPQQALTKEQLAGLVGAASGLSVLSAQGIEAILGTVAGMAQGSPLYVPTYSTVAPGLDLAIKPSVLPGGRAARLLINFRASASVADTDTAKKRYDPIDFVKSHETSTDVAVNAFDLFPLSTFSVETTALGDPQWRIYGLEGIPILGNMFIGPRRPVTSVGRSLVIVYTTILPRSLDIARRYSAASR